MSERKVNLKEILAEWVSKNLQEQGRSKEASDAVAKTSIENGGYWYILEAMKETCRQILELAAKNAKCDDDAIIDLGHTIVEAYVNKQSITDTINQVE